MDTIRRYTALPVVDPSGALVGILTESDLFHALGGEWPLVRAGP